ncbi:MAG TPA: hypothetical protein VEF04_16140 [Blastocatellia bacterium]|nr:hypothetical protein [Blastocatellia bacterium]
MNAPSWKVGFMNIFDKSSDLPAIAAALNTQIIAFAARIAGALDLHGIEAALTHIPVWTNAITGIVGAAFLIVKAYFRVTRYLEKRRERKRISQLMP